MSLIDFFEIAGKLKSTQRMGWVSRGVSNPESVAEHSFRTALISAVLADELGVDAAKAVKMALVHDLAEAVTGDYRKRLNESDQELSDAKQMELEKNAMEEIVANLPPQQAKEIMGIWLEYQEDKSPEARLVKEVGKLEVSLQAMEYEREGNYKKSLEEFFIYSRQKMRNETVLELLAEIEARRKKGAPQQNR